MLGEQLARRRRPPVPHDTLPIRTVASMTGLTPDLIRAWEKRYSVVKPERGARGARLYSAADVARLRLLARAVRDGRAIGDVAALTTQELRKLLAVAEIDTAAAFEPHSVPAAEQVVSRAIDRVADYDTAGVACLLADTLLVLGAGPFAHKIAVPLMHRLGELWSQRKLSIAHEHVLTAALRNLLGGLLLNRARAGRQLLLATPAGEQHEMGLLLVALLACEAGVGVSYLGAGLPAAEIVAAARRLRPGAVGLSLVTARNRRRAVAVVRKLNAALDGHVEMWLGGADAPNVADRIRSFRGVVFSDLQTTAAALAPLAARVTRDQRPRS